MTEVACVAGAETAAVTVPAAVTEVACVAGAETGAVTVTAAPAAADSVAERGPQEGTGLEAFLRPLSEFLPVT